MSASYVHGYHSRENERLNDQLARDIISPWVVAGEGTDEAGEPLGLAIGPGLLDHRSRGFKRSPAASCARRYRS